MSSLLIIFCAPAISAESKVVQVIEWNYGFNVLEIDIPTSTNNSSFLHEEMKRRIPYFDEVYGAWPISIRYPNEIYIEKSAAADTCYQIPVQFRAEVDLKYLRDTNNPIEIEFWPRVIFSDNTVTFREPSLKITPSDWTGSNTILERSLPICLSKELLGTSLIGLNLRFNLVYSRLFTEYNVKATECWSHTAERCKYIGIFGAGVTVNQTQPNSKDEVGGYLQTIADIKTFLSFPQNIDKRSIEIARRNLVFLEGDLQQAKIRSEMKAAADKAAADKAAADKAAADKAAADKAAAKPVAKEKTIVCLKGKSSLKVIGKNPKCPAGYKVKK